MDDKTVVLFIIYKVMELVVLVEYLVPKPTHIYE